MSIAERLKMLRDERGVRQADVAAALGMHEQNYARYERGNRIPRIEQLIALADYFDVSLDYLAGRTDGSNLAIMSATLRTRLAQRRHEMGLSQKELAAASNLSERSIQRYEAGEVDPRIDRVIDIARALNTSVEYLCGAVDDPDPAKLYDLLGINP